MFDIIIVMCRVVNHNQSLNMMVGQELLRQEILFKKLFFTRNKYSWFGNLYFEQLRKTVRKEREERKCKMSPTAE